MTSPTVGRRGGEHRVLEPVGATPLDATRLDALADLWDGELRLELEAAVLSRSSHRGWVERLGGDPSRLAAAVAESVAERGGLGEEGRDATLVGRVAAVGPAHPHQVTVGERVAVSLPAGAVPLFAAPEDRYDGGLTLPLRGHAVVPAAGVTVPAGDAPPALAALLARTADLPTTLAAGARIVVVGVDRPAGAVAIAVAASQMRHVTAVVTSLSAARLARALGADATAVVATNEPVDGADHLAARGSRADLAVLADPTGAALAVRAAAAVQVVTDPFSHPTVVADVVAHAAACGRSVAVHAGRGSAPDRGLALRRLVADRDVLSATLRWQAGLAPLPTLARSDDDGERS